MAPSLLSSEWRNSFSLRCAVKLREEAQAGNEQVSEKGVSSGNARRDVEWGIWSKRGQGSGQKATQGTSESHH